MKHKHPQPTELSATELQLIQQLREHPEVMERVHHILEIAANAEGPVKRADEIEALLLEEMRRLGNVTLQSWASRAERTLGEQLKQKDSSAVVRKKNTDLVVRFRCGKCSRTGLADRAEEISAFTAGGHWCEPAGTVQAVGACINRFWQRACLPARGRARAGALRI